MATIINRGRKSNLIKPQQLHPIKRAKRQSNFDPETIREYSAILKARENAEHV
jgi:hypothetical protein